jgi:hypothetical protein
MDISVMSDYLLLVVTMLFVGELAQGELVLGT